MDKVASGSYLNKRGGGSPHSNNTRNLKKISSCRGFFSGGGERRHVILYGFKT